MSARQKITASLGDDVERLADLICAITGIKRVRSDDRRRARSRRLASGTDASADRLRKIITDEIEKGI